MQTTQPISFDRRVPIYLEDVVSEIKKLAEEMPDFLYKSVGASEAFARGCQYTKGGSDKYQEHCGCIVGQAMVRSVSPEHRPTVLAALKTQDAWAVTSFVNLIRLANDPKEYDYKRIDTVKFVVRPPEDLGSKRIDYVVNLIMGITTVQDRQDQHDCWSKAVLALDAVWCLGMFADDRYIEKIAQIVLDIADRHNSQTAA